MNNDELRQLITLMQATDLNVLELTRPNWRVRLEMVGEIVETAYTGAGGMAQAENLTNQTDAGASGAELVKAPHFGIFSSRHPARSEAYVQEGQQVACGDTLGMLRINELYTPVLSPAAGRLHRLVDDEVLIGYATPLFEIAAG